MKHHYDPSERICSEDFDPSMYWNRDELRKFKKETKDGKTSDDLSALFQIINESGYIAIYELVDFVNENRAELRDTLMSNFYQFKAYIDSKTKVLELKSTLTEKIKRLELDNRILSKQLWDEKEDVKAVMEQNRLLREYVMEFEDGLTLRIR